MLSFNRSIEDLVTAGSVTLVMEHSINQLQQDTKFENKENKAERSNSKAVLEFRFEAEGAKYVRGK